jgi:hypothetical protein
MIIKLSSVASGNFGHYRSAPTRKKDIAEDLTPSGIGRRLTNGRKALGSHTLQIIEPLILDQESPCLAWCPLTRDLNRTLGKLMIPFDKECIAPKIITGDKFDSDTAPHMGSAKYVWYLDPGCLDPKGTSTTDY